MSNCLTAIGMIWFMDLQLDFCDLPNRIPSRHYEQTSFSPVKATDRDATFRLVGKLSLDKSRF